MQQKLTRAELGDRIHGLKAAALRIVRDSREEDQAEAIAAEAEALEHRVASDDREFFFRQVEALMAEAGVIQPVVIDEQADR